MKPFLLFFALFISLIYVSCKNEADFSGDLVTPRTDYSTYKLDSVDISIIGAAHNLHLQEVLDDMIENTPEIDDSGELLDYFANFPFEIDGFEGKPEEEFRENIWEILDSPPTGTAGSIIESIMEDWDEVDNISEANTLVVSAFNSLEANTSLSVVDHNTVASYLGVLKYSSYFWFDTGMGGSGLGRYYMDELNAEYPTLFDPAPTTAMTSRSRWKTIAAGDALGAAVSMLEWCVIGAATGVGALGGLIGGAVYGAVSGSLLAAGGA